MAEAQALAADAVIDDDSKHLQLLCAALEAVLLYGRIGACLAVAVGEARPRRTVLTTGSATTPTWLG